MSGNDNQPPKTTFKDGFTRSGQEGFNINPPGSRNALPASTPKAPPPAPDKPKQN